MHEAMDRKQVVEINWKPNRESEIPVYRQIISYVSDRIQCGDWMVGQKLPPQRQLSAQFGVNRSTIVTAMDELISYGILESGYGGGTHIASNTWSLMMSAPPNWNKYVTAGGFRANLDTIQIINRLEFDNSYVRLGTGELSPELYPKQIIGKVMKRLANQIDSLNYLEPLGMLSLRETLAARLQEKGIQVKPSNILITSGSLQALHLISICMLKVGSMIHVESPSYLKSLQVFQSAGMRLRGVGMDQEGMLPWKLQQGMELDKDEFSLLYTIPTFHNPTGIVMTQQRRREIFDRCRKLRIPIIEDDAYGELWIDKAPPAPLKSMDENGTVLYLGTVSKTLVPGLRIGWLVGSETVVARLGDVKMQTDYGASSISQLIVNELIRSGEYDQYLGWLREELRKRRDFTLDVLNRYFIDLADWEEPQGGFYIWVRMKRMISSDQLFRHALKEHLLLNPGSVYDDMENHALRISYSYAELGQLERSLCTLSKLIRQM